MSDQPDDNERREPNEEEFLRKLFGEAFGDKSGTGDDDSSKDDSGPSIGFTGTPGGRGQDSGAPSGGFPGFPPASTPLSCPPALATPR